MKLAWICYKEYHTDWADSGASVISTPIILFREPNRNLYEMIIPIVYTEIVK
jgi:hypothetical protein